MDTKLLALLEQFKTQDLAGNVPSISKEVGNFLHTLIQENKLSKGLEIGCAHAYSTIWIADALQKNNGKLTTLDHSTPSFAIAQENVKKSGLKNIEMHFGRAQEIIPRLSGSFDFIFIDGIKKSTLDFFHLVGPKLAKNGVIVVDDVLKFKYKMEDFWNFMSNTPDWNHTIYPLDEDDGIMVIKPKTTR